MKYWAVTLAIELCFVDASSQWLTSDMGTIQLTSKQDLLEFTPTALKLQTNLNII